MADEAGVEERGGGFEHDGFVLLWIRGRGLGREGCSRGRRGGVGDRGDVSEPAGRGV